MIIKFPEGCRLVELLRMEGVNGVFLCSCGGTVKARPHNVRSGGTRSCGCLRREKALEMSEANVTHGHSRRGQRSPTYTTWWSMMGRCYHPGTASYKYYGAKGITVCERWHKFENFLEDMGERPLGKEIDRLSDKDNYSKGNCRWATHQENCANRENARVS